MLRAFVRAVWTICKKDLRVWLRQPSNVAITVLPALALLFVDALSAGAVGRSPVALVTLDQGARGQQMAQIIHQADLFRVSDATPAQAQALYNNLDVVAIVTIPANFTHAVDAHAPAHIEVQINNLNTDFTNDIRRAVPDAITQFYQQQGSESPIKVTLQEQNLRRQDIQLFQYSAMPLLVLLLVVSGLVSSSLAAAGEWETRTIKELLLSPASSGAIISWQGAHRLRDDHGPGGAGAGSGEPARLGPTSRGLLADCPADSGVGGAVQRGIGSGSGSPAAADSAGEFRRHCHRSLPVLSDRGNGGAGL